MRVFLLLVLMCLAPQSVLAWGQEGHAIIAEIAQRHLSNRARAKIADLLGLGVSLASIASWADDVRSERPETYNWHFVDIPLDAATYEPARDCRLNPEKGDCIIAEISRARAGLKDARTSPRARREALKYLVHFVGDLHQPLHTLLEEHGGNDRKVTFFKEPNTGSELAPREATNLHAVWDSGLIRHCVWSWNAYVARLQNDWLPKRDINALARGTAIEWAEEAHKAARDVAFTVPENAELGEDYVARTLPTLDRQLALAGLRLARILNETLGADRALYPASIPPEMTVGWYCRK
jgi:hypothetical protein